MPTPSTGPITATDIANEFDGAKPHAISEYYGANGNIPSSGTIKYSDFRGQSDIPVIPSPENIAGNGTWTPQPGDWTSVTVRMWGGGASGGSGGPSHAGSGGGGGGFVGFNISRADVPASVTYSVGAYGAAQGANYTAGNNGGNTTFGGAVAGGGIRGISGNENPGGNGGTASAPTLFTYSGLVTEVGGKGGNGRNLNGSPGQARTWAGGGGGGSSETSGYVGGAGGVSTNGGNGSAGSNANSTGSQPAGQTPGGGGGGSDMGTSGPGGGGRITIIYNL